MLPHPPIKKLLTTEQILATAVALLRLAVCCYRAVHQSLVDDEAFTFQRFVQVPWSDVWEYYDANNHVLHSLLVKGSVKIFGLSEFTLRLPSVLGGFLLILGVFWLLQQTRSVAIRWVAFVATCLHPFLLDFSVAARGYSLSLAFFVWAAYCTRRRWYAAAGLLLGLAASANLSIAFPALGLMVAVVLLEQGSVTRRLKILSAMAVISGAVFFAVCHTALLSAHRESFYVGHTNFADAVFGLIYWSIRAKVNELGLFGSWDAAMTIRTFLLPLLSVAILVSSGRDFLRHREARHRFLPLLTLLLTIPGLMAAHYLFGLKYPVERAWLYVVLLFGVAWAIAADGSRNRAWQGVHLVLASLLVVQFASQFQTRHFWYWLDERDDKEIAEILRKECSGKPANTMTVSTNWRHQPALEFYREYLHITALRPIERQDPALFAGHDFYVLSGSDTKQVEGAQLRVLFSDPAANVLLVVPRMP